MPYEVWRIYDQVVRFASFLTIPMLAFSVFLLIKSIRKSQAMTVRFLLLQMATPLLVLTVYSALMPVSAPFLPISLALIVGFGVGAGWSMTVKLRLEEGEVLGKRSFIYLVFWAATLAVTQVYAGIAWYRWVGYTIPAFYFSSGIGVGMHAMLLLRRMQLTGGGARLAFAGQSAPPAPALCPACGAHLPEGQRFCTHCGRPLV